MDLLCRAAYGPFDVRTGNEGVSKSFETHEMHDEISITLRFWAVIVGTVQQWVLFVLMALAWESNARGWHRECAESVAPLFL